MAEEGDTATGAGDSGHDANNDSHDDNGDDHNKSLNAKDKSPYRQKYKHAWELDPELREWLTACPSDPFSGYCKYCRAKLHAHKKGLLAHSKSSKHKKNIDNYDPTRDPPLPLVPSDSFNLRDANGNRHIPDIGDFFAEDGGAKRNHKGQRVFNDIWLSDPIFSQWLRKVPSNNTRALCIACRCVIAAGKSELIKHTKAAKHKKAIGEGNFTEISEQDLQWLDYSGINDNQNQSGMIQDQSNARPSIIDLPGLLVDDILDRLDKHVPLSLAESWDNVGIIVKPSRPVKVYNLLLTIDLNEKIVEEAIRKRVQFIISYHPPIFSPIKRLDPKFWKDKAILMCVEHKITVYSPHTALDAVKGGINDWLISSFLTSDSNKIRPLHHSTTGKDQSCLELLVSEPVESVSQVFNDPAQTITAYGETSTDIKAPCDDRTLAEFYESLAEKNWNQVTNRVVKLQATPIPGIGMGRVITFDTPLPLYEVVQRTKTHLDLTYIRMALSPKHTRDTRVTSIAACAGSGASVLKGCKADVWITGEMSHHEVLDATNSGSTVILCEHTNTERGFLRDWSQQLRSAVFEDQVMVTVSEIDRDPLRIV